MKQIVIILVLSGALVFASWWLFEDLFFPVTRLHAIHADNPIGIITSALLSALVLAACGWTILWHRGATARVIGATLFIAAAAGGAYLGGHFASAALNECAQDPERLRRSLATYRALTGHFPRRLEELGTVPCRRPLRGTIVWYRSDGKTYDLAFGDWLVSWHGTDREPITPIK